MSIRLGSQEEPYRRGQSPPNRPAQSAFIDLTPVRFLEKFTDPVKFEKWRQIQQPYKNLATNEDIASVALTFMKENLSHYESQIEPVWDTWAVIEKYLSAHEEPSQDVRIPELYKAIETIVPRVVEALTDLDPWFQVFGRERMDVEEEELLRDYMDFQLDQAQFLSRWLEKGVYCLCKHSIAPFYTYWRVDRKKKLVRDLREVANRRGIGVNATKQMKEEILYEGPAMVLIDPYDFFVDLDSDDVESASWIGHTVWMTWSDLSDPLLGYVNLDKVKELENSTKEAGSLRRYYKRSRAPNVGDADPRQAPDGAPRKYKVDICYAKMDIFGDGKIDNYKIVRVEDKVIVNVQLNENDDGYVPYAVAKISDRPFQWFPSGPFDHAARLQSELNDHRNIALRNHRFSGPIGFVAGHAEIPSNLFILEPGTMWRVNNPGDVVFTKIPDTIRETQMITEEIRRDIEEVTGALRLLAGGDAGQTATETDRRYVEANRRIWSYVRSMVLCCNRLMQNFHAMNGQFIRKTQVFRVLGKKAAGLTVYAEIHPESFQRHIDFEFSALFGLKNFGIRANQMTKWLQLASSPVVYEATVGLVNWAGVLREYYKLTVNPRPTDDLIMDPGILNKLVTPEQENLMIMRAMKVETHPLDDDTAHEKVHRQLLDSMDDVSEVVQKNFVAHMELHAYQRKQKTARKQAQQGFVPSMLIPRGQGQEPSQMTEQGRAGAVMGPAGNPQFGQTPGETPGPPGVPERMDRGFGRGMDNYQAQGGNLE